MIEYTHRVAGEPVSIKVAEDYDDLSGFRDFIRGNLRFLGLDSETTGLDIYSDDYRCRTVQFGTPTEAWVIPVERGGQFVADTITALKAVDKFVLHNASFDLQVFDRCLGVPMSLMWPKVTDTKILSHLIDPRGKKEGGTGHSLEELTRAYIDPDVADGVKSLMTNLAKAHKTKNALIWKEPELVSHPDFQLYAGMDPVLACRLMREALPAIPGTARGLVPFEHRLAEVCAYMERTGFLLDVEYTQQLSDKLEEDQERWAARALALGLENVNSPQQVAAALTDAGVKIKGRTPTGNLQVDQKLLDTLAADDPEKRSTQLAEAIREAKKSGKWRKTWVQKFLDSRDSADRCHASINPLQARTARMTITGIPAQTLPSGDWTIRRCFIADPGELIASVDYQAQELRVLAAMSGDRTMIHAFQEGADLHLMTARAAFGDHIVKGDPEREHAKTVNFGRVYGGGAKTVAEQTGLPVKQAQIVVDGFDRAYPKVGVYSKKLMGEAGYHGFITTPTGRRLPVDPDRAYAALNFMIQSTSRDVTARAIIRLHDRGFTPFMRLPIHDEVLLSLPASEAEAEAKAVADIMAEKMGPVWIGTDPEVGGRSWGSLYMKTEERELCDLAG